MVTQDKKKDFYPQTILLVLLLFTPYTWYILPKDPLIALLSITLSFVLLRGVLTYPKKIFLINITLVVLFLIITLLILLKGFDKEIWITPSSEISQQIKRQNFYAEGFGKLYRNRIGIYYFENINSPLFKIQRNLFSNIDMNLYFFASHPRERGGLIEFEKYLYIFLPIFLYGVYEVAKQRKFILGYYFISALLISSFIRSDYLLGPILFFPLINSILSMGAISLLFKRNNLKGVSVGGKSNEI